MMDLESQFTFPILGVSEENIHRKTRSRMSMKEMLEQDSLILSVEKSQRSEVLVNGISLQLEKNKQTQKNILMIL